MHGNIKCVRRETYCEKLVPAPSSILLVVSRILLLPRACLLALQLMVLLQPELQENI